VAGSGVDQLVNLWKRKAILWASLIEVCVVDADPSLAVSFLYHYHIGQPLGVVGFSDEPCLEEFAHLFIYYFLSFGGKASLLLLDWLIPRSNFQPMSDHFDGNPWHVRSRPSEDISIIPEEADQLRYGFFIKHTSDLHNLGGVLFS